MQDICIASSGVGVVPAIMERVSRARMRNAITVIIQRKHLNSESVQSETQSTITLLSNVHEARAKADVIKTSTYLLLFSTSCDYEVVKSSHLKTGSSR